MSILRHRISIRPEYIEVTGNSTQGLILSQLMYWMPRRTYKFGRFRWIVKTMGDLAGELGLKTDTVRKAIKKLADSGFIFKECATEFGKKHSFIRVNLQKLREAVFGLYADQIASDQDDQTEKSPDGQGSKRKNRRTQTEKSPDGQGSKRKNRRFSYHQRSSLSDTVSDTTRSSETASPKYTADDLLSAKQKLSSSELQAIEERCVTVFNRRQGTGEPVLYLENYIAQAIINAADSKKITATPDDVWEAIANGTYEMETHTFDESQWGVIS